LDWGDKPHLLSVAVAVLAAAFVIYRHRSNIDRIRKGTETKFSVQR
jgi:glycerol-3-phosphate acyltransferase PlsY